MKTRAGKRGAGSDLNHDNWDVEEEAEERGQFQTASADVISRRKIKVAKRRAGSEDAGTGGLFKSFTGFAPATAPSLTGSAIPAFNFGSYNSSDSKPFTFTASGATAGKVEAPAQFGFNPSSATTSFGDKSSSTKPEKKEEEAKVSTRDQHLHSLRDLNVAVNKWISTHVEKNPYCDLSPVFADYERHLREIEKKYPYDEEGEKKPESETATLNAAGSDSNGSAQVSVSPSKPPIIAFGSKGVTMDSKSQESEEEEDKAKSTAIPSLFSFGSKGVTTDSKSQESEEDKAKSAAIPSLFSFSSKGVKMDSKSQESEEEEDKAKSTAIPSLFSFGSKKKTDSESKIEDEEGDKEDDETGEEDGGETKEPKASLFTNMKFNFGPGPALGGSAPTFPFTGLSSWSSSPLANSLITAKPAEGEEEDYVPPKVEVKEIKEEGSVLTRRCKLYYKWEDAWVDKGVGNVHLKPLDGEKLQFLVRADTNLGNILLNVMVNATIPITRTKANLTLICVPSPRVRPKPKGEEDKPDEPLPLLVRFKTEADAEKILEEINRLRKKE